VSAASLYVTNRLLSGMQRGIDVPNGTIAEPSCIGIILFTLLAKCYDVWLQPVVIEPADLKMISIPVLVMAGDHDFTSIEDNSEIFRDLPHGQLIVVPARIRIAKYVA
jgi:pimeloyl-ACP methyl ester carboxylesterase